MKEDVVFYLSGARALPGCGGSRIARPLLRTTTPRRHRVPTAHATSQRQRARSAPLAASRLLGCYARTPALALAPR